MSPVEVFRCERAKGASMGATIMGGFGAVWLALGMTAAGVPVSIALAVVVPVFVLIACMASVVTAAAAEVLWRRELLRRSR